jgi:transposase InsO family protein
MKYRRFTQDFKRSLIEQLLSESALGGRYHLHTDFRLLCVFGRNPGCLFEKGHLGYALSKRLDTRLAFGALHMAISDRHPEPGCIHHSDRGVQYASGEYVKELTLYNFQISMSRKGNPYDNAYAESFIKTLKSEEVELWECRTMEDAQESIHYFIEDVYNQKRLHSSLGYRPPCDFETMVMLTQSPCQRALIASP